jgi:hypothetical protein
MTITDAEIYKHYHTHAAIFYVEKGLTWITLDCRIAYNKTMRDVTLKAVSSPKRSRSTGTPFALSVSPFPESATLSPPVFPDVLPGPSGNDLVVMNTQVPLSIVSHIHQSTPKKLLCQTEYTRYPYHQL